MTRSTLLAAALAATTAIAAPTAHAEVIGAQPLAQPASPASEQGDRSDNAALGLTLLGGWVGTSGGVVLAATGLLRIHEAPTAGGRLGGAALIAGGLTATTFGPSLGHRYGTGSWWSTGAKIRAGTLATAAVLLATASREDDARCPSPEMCSPGGRGNAKLAIVVGFVGVTAGNLWDLATVRGATRRANARRAAHAGVRAQIAPTMVAGHASTGAGLGITGTF